MYIPEFWCGVAATFITEVILLVVFIAWFNSKHK